MRALTAGLLTLALAGCAGRAELNAGAGGGGAAPPTTSTSGPEGGFAEHPDCASADGVRLCGGSEQCPPLEPPDCPGYGCTAALDRATYEPSSAGVCWADVPDAAAVQCTACRDGQVCVQRDPEQLVCVAPEVCEALWDIGATTVCRYADKSSYDHRPLSDTGLPCPVAGSGDVQVLCGGACGECPSGWRCTGRSPLHPFGVCAYLEEMLGSEALAVYPCSVSAGGAMLASCEGSIMYEALCGVFAVPDQDRTAARRYGTCLSPVVCQAAASQLPGGLFCYDDSGNQVAP